MVLLSTLIISNILISCISSQSGQQFCGSGDCKDCLTTTCGYDCTFASKHSIVCDSCVDKCSSLGTIKYNQGSVREIIAKDAINPSLCEHNSFTGSLYNSCINNYDANSANRGFLLKCDSTTNYEIQYMNYQGLETCGGALTSTSKSIIDKETGEIKKCNPTVVNQGNKECNSKSTNERVVEFIPGPFCTYGPNQNDCSDCLVNSCGYDCAFASEHGIVCDACQDKCSRLGAIKYNAGFVREVKSEDVTDATICAYNSFSGSLLNKCIKTFNKNGDENRGLLLKCDETTQYKWVGYQYKGIKTCDETPLISEGKPWMDSKINKQRTCEKSAVDQSNKGCNSKTSFDGWNQ